MMKLGRGEDKGLGKTPFCSFHMCQEFTNKTVHVQHIMEPSQSYLEEPGDIEKYDHRNCPSLISSDMLC